MSSLLRRLAAIAVLAYYAYFFFDYARFMPPQLSKAVWAISAIYTVALLGVTFGWFWGRWFARGLGYWGIIVGVLFMWQLGLENWLLFWAGTNAAVSLLLAGDGMAARFDGRQDWRMRFHLDDNGVERLGKSVTRVGMSLPWLLLYVLVPKPKGSGEELLMVSLFLAGAGMWGLLRARTWGLLALAGASIATTAQVLSTPSAAPNVGMLAAISLAAVVVPFAGPIAARLRA
jgi:hypothetical protein